MGEIKHVTMEAFKFFHNNPYILSPFWYVYSNSLFSHKNRIPYMAVGTYSTNFFGQTVGFFYREAFHYPFNTPMVNSYCYFSIPNNFILNKQPNPIRFNCCRVDSTHSNFCFDYLFIGYLVIFIH